MKNDVIKLAHGSGGAEMQELIKLIRKNIPYKGNWKCTDEDSAALYTDIHRCEHRLTQNDTPALQRNSVKEKIPLSAKTVCLRRQVDKYPPAKTASRLSKEGEFIVFTTDAFVVTPIFFNGGNIGDLAFNGTVNDLLMQGAKPLGLSLALALEEGFPLDELKKILKTIGALSEQTKIPIATGDTKVVGKGALDKIMITTAGVGIAENIISDRGLKPGDKIIASGTLGDHGAALLAHRFGYKTELTSDTKPLLREMAAVGKYLTAAKDPTRGGIAAVMNELSEKSRVKIALNEKSIPISKQTVSIAKLLGINELSLASEGRFVAGVAERHSDKVIKILKKFNKDSCIIGRVEKGEAVFVKNFMGEKKLELPSGVLVPRIC